MSYIHQDLAMFLTALVGFILFLRLKSKIRKTIDGTNWFFVGFSLFVVFTFIDYIEDTPLSYVLPDATNEAKWDFIVMVLGYTPAGICICIGLAAWLKTARQLQKAIEQSEITEKELKLALEEAREANETKNKFLSTISHELRIPLNAIIGFAQIMGDEKHIKLTEEKYREYSNIILSSSRHLLETIDHLLSLAAQNKTERYQIKEEVLCVEDEVKDCLYLLEMDAKTAGISYVKNLSLGTYLSGDKRLIKQILINLLSNAIKFSKKGGVVTCSVETTDSEQILVRIEDEGIGMTKAQIKQATHPLSVIEEPTTRKKMGIGVGLTLAKRFTELHGGSLDIKSEKGKGTAVTITFPKSRTLEPV